MWQSLAEGFTVEGVKRRHAREKAQSIFGGMFKRTPQEAHDDAVQEVAILWVMVGPTLLGIAVVMVRAFI